MMELEYGHFATLNTLKSRDYFNFRIVVASGGEREGNGMWGSLQYGMF